MIDVEKLNVEKGKNNWIKINKEIKHIKIGIVTKDTVTPTK